MATIDEFESKYIQEAAKYNWKKDIKRTKYVDFQDESGKWSVGIIQDIMPNMLRVGYEGWLSQYDTFVPLEGDRIDSIRSHTRGYTGAKQKNQRELFFFAEETITEAIEQIQNLILTDLETMDPFQFTHFVRGSLFFLIDSLLASNFQIKEEQGGVIDDKELPSILDLCKNYCELYIKWLTLLPSLFGSYNECQLNPKLYLVSPHGCIASAGPEFAETLKLFFDENSNRTEKAFKEFGKRMSGESWGENKDWFTNQIICYISKEAIPKIYSLVTQKIPLKLLIDIIDPYAFGITTKKDEFNDFAKKIFKDLLPKLQKIDNSDMKQIDLMTMIRLQSILEAFYTWQKGKSGKEQSLEVMLNMAISLIKSPILNCKLTGLGLIIKMLDKKEEEKAAAEKKEEDKMKWANRTELAKQIINLKLIENIFDENAHQEVLRRSQEILIFLLDNSYFPNGMSSIIWKCCMSKHEDIVRVSFSILINLLPKFNEMVNLLFITFYQQLAEIFKLVKLIRIEDYSEYTIKYLEKHTEAGLQMGNNPRTQERMYDMEIFWIIIFEGKQNEKLKEIVMESFCKLADKFPDIKEEYIKRIGEIIQNPTKQYYIPRCLQILIRINFIEYMTKKKSNYYDNAKDLEKYIKENDLIQVVLNSCMDCHQKIAVKIKENPELKKSVLTLEVETNDEMTFGKQAKLYLDFLQEVSTASKNFALDMAFLEVIWNLYYIDQFSVEHCNFLWDILQKEKKGDVFGFFTTKREASDFFNIYFSNPKQFILKNMTLPALRCFKKYFDYLNDNKDQYGRQIKLSVDRIQGLDTLWNIALESDDNDVQKTSAGYLVEVYYKTLTEINENKRAVVEHFITQVLTKQYPDVAKFHLSINVLNAFISKVEISCTEADIDPITFNERPVYEIKLLFPESRDTFSIEISEKRSTYDLIKKISAMLSVQQDRIKLYHTGDGEVTNDHLLLLSSINSIVNFLAFDSINIRISPDVLKKEEKPRYILANSPALFDLLLEKLSSNNKIIVEDVWKLIENIPKNETYYTKIQSFPSDIADWVKYLEFKNFEDYPKIAYSLYLFSTALESFSSKKEQLDKYKNELNEKKGINFLVQILNNSVKKFEIVSIKCIAFCLKILNSLWEEKYFKSFFSSEFELQNLWNSVDSIISLILEGNCNGIISQSEQTELFRNSTSMMLNLIMANQAIFKMKIISPDYFQKLKKGLFSTSEQLRICIKEWLLILNQSLIFASQEKAELEAILLKFILDHLLDISIKLSDYSYQFFEFFLQIIMQIGDAQLAHLYSPVILEKINSYIFKNIEIRPKNINYTLCGLMELFAFLIQKDNAGILKNLGELYKVLTKSLFGFYDQSIQAQKICLTCGHLKTRTKALQLLNAVITKLKNQDDFLAYMTPLYKQTSWRMQKFGDWSISPVISEKFPGGYIGLENMGATCYLNSVIQQLFMIPYFRNPLLSIDASKSDKKILLELQEVFGVLYEQEYSPYKPQSLCDTLKINTFVQRDVSEFLITLLDTLQDLLKNTPCESLIRDIFEIKTSTEICCQRCKTKKETISTSLILGLEVKNKESIMESLGAFIKPESLQGENSYQCGKCGTKENAIKRETLHTLPNVLLVQLKRFEIRYEGSSLKLNSYCEFPLELDVEEFSQNAQIKREIRQSAPGATNLAIRDLPKEYFVYKLKGFILHVGTMESGHYYSIIHDNEQNMWLEFNDCVIRVYDIKHLKDEAFGSKNTGPCTPEEMMARSNNSYILVYQRELILPSEIIRKIELKSDNLSSKIILENAEKYNQYLKKEMEKPKLSEAVSKKLMVEKETFLLQQFVFQPEYLTFIANILKGCTIPHDIKIIQDLPPNLEFIYMTYLTTLLRSTMKEEVFIFTNCLCEYCRTCPGFSLYIVGMFNIPEIIREFFVDCPKVEARKCLATLLKEAIKIVYPLEEKEINDYCASQKAAISSMIVPSAPPPNKIAKIDETGSMLKQSIPKTMCLLFAFIKQIDSINKNYCGQYFAILSSFAKTSDQFKEIMCDHLIFEASLEILGIIKKKSWTKNAAQSIPENENHGISCIMPVTADCSKVEGHLDEKAIAMHTIYILELVQELVPCQYNRKKRNVGNKDIEDISVLLEENTFRTINKYVTNSKIALNRYSSILVAICLNREHNNYTPFLDFLSKSLETSPTTDLKLYFRIIGILLRSSNLQLFNEIFQRTIKLIKAEFNKHYFQIDYASGICFIDFLIKLCQTNQNFLETLRKQKDLPGAKDVIENGLEWININKNKKDCKLARNSTKIIGKENEETLKICKHNIASREIALQGIKDRIQKEEEMKMDLGEDSDDDNISYLKQKKQCDIFIPEKKAWFKAEVIENAGDFIKFVYNGNVIWIESDSNKIAPLGTRCDNLFFKEKELLFLSASSK